MGLTRVWTDMGGGPLPEALQQGWRPRGGGEGCKRPLPSLVLLLSCWEQLAHGGDPRGAGGSPEHGADGCPCRQGSPRAWPGLMYSVNKRVGCAV